MTWGLRRRRVYCGLAVASWVACATGPGRVPSGESDPGDLLIVDCLLPPDVRVLGQRATYFAARKGVKTTAADCRTRGGEYTDPGQASQASALRVWVPRAEAGESEAQNYVGEIFEKGLGGDPDFEAAAVWYRRAAEQGLGAALINLGSLYERGLGVPRDARQAQSLYRRASGLAAVGLPFVAEQASSAQVETLRADLTRRERDIRELHAELARLRTQLQRHEDDRRGRAELEGRAQDLERARAELEGTRKQIASDRRELEDARDRLARENEELATQGERSQAVREQQEQLRQELERRNESLTRREGDLEERERGFDERAESFEDPVAKLQTKIARLEARLEDSAQDRASRAQEGVVLAGPSIHLINPPLPLQRGVRVTASFSPASERALVGRVDAPAGLLLVTVNDRETSVEENGIFRSSLAVPEAGLQVAIVAVDRAGRRAERRLRLERAQAAEPAAVPPRTRPLPDFGRYHALVIGNARYQHVTPLETAERDAVAVSRLLESRYGYQVSLVRNATRYQILSSLNELRSGLTEKDNLLIYYAGHGELDRANMRGHWLPVDAEPDSSANWISNVAITDILNAMSARHVLVIADSCYSGSLTRSSLARLEAGMTEEARRAWTETMLSKRSRTALTSGGLQPVLDQGGGAHSIFARVLLELLETNAEVLEAQRLYRDLAARVVWAAEGVRFEQTPQYAPIQFSGHEAGEFFFVPREIRSGELDSQPTRHTMAHEVGVTEQGLVIGEEHHATR